MTFGESWGPAQVFCWLRECLPRVFEHMALSHPWINAIGPEDDTALLQHSLPYVLLFPFKKNFTVVPKTHPNGRDCAEFKGRNAQGPKLCAIWMGTQSSLRNA